MIGIVNRQLMVFFAGGKSYGKKQKHNDFTGMSFHYPID
jgi:hypothetical protein